MPELAYVNGRFGPLADAKISVEDRGFQFADGVYEVVVAFGQEVFRLGAHLERLKRSLALIDMPLDLERLGVEAAIREGIERAGYRESMVYIQVTRGLQPRAHDYREPVEPTIVMTFKAKQSIAPGERARGYSVMTVEDFRWRRCEIKSVALLANVLAKNRALKQGYDDAVFLGPHNVVREGTSANVFAVRGGSLITPVTEEAILHGVTRVYILECARRAGIEFEERSIMLEELASADEAFLSSTTLDIMPLAKLDGRPVGQGAFGPVTRRLYDEYLEGLPCPAGREKRAGKLRH